MDDLPEASKLGREEVIDTLKLKLKLSAESDGNISRINRILEKYHEFIMRLCNSIIEQTMEFKDTLEIGTLITKIQDHLNSIQAYITDNIDDDKEDIFQYVTKDDEYEDLLNQQIARLREDEIYLSLHHLVKQSPYNLSWLSPKYVQIFRNLIKAPGSVFVYSQFLTAEGIGIFTEMLKKNGFKQLMWRRELDGSISTKEEFNSCSIVNSKKSVPGVFNDSDSFSVGDLVRWTRVMEDGNECSTTHRIIQIDDSGIGITKSSELEVMYEALDFTQFTKANIIQVSLVELSLCRYVLWTGKQTDIQERIDILNKFNSKHNKYGQECLILLATSSGAEGISLANVRQVHIMEPYWNNVRTKQVTGRARRIKSHITLAEDQRNVEVFKYFSTFSSEQLDDIKMETLAQGDVKKIIEDINTLSDKDVDDGTKADSIEIFINLFNKYTRELKSIDKGKSTDDHLRFIANQKEKLLNKFLYMVKETAIDCAVNLDENRSSDPENLGLLECHAPDASLDGLTSNKGYTYKLNPLIRSMHTIDSDQQKERKTISDVSSKYQVLEFTLTNEELGFENIKLKCLIFPSNISQKQIKNRSQLFNYYSYFGINPVQKGEKVKIGRFIDSNLELDPDFLQYVNIFEIVNRLDDSLKALEPKFKANFKEDVDMFTEYKTYILTKYQAILSEEGPGEIEIKDKPPQEIADNQWECPLCDTINQDDADVCTNPECDMEKEDL